MRRTSDKPDFEALRAQRNDAVTAAVHAACAQHGRDVAKVETTFNPNACSCACPGGPCEHDFQGWRKFEDGHGGDTVCTRCGMGAMSHSIRTSD
jgi:hypothetical protein